MLKCKLPSIPLITISPKIVVTFRITLFTRYKLENTSISIDDGGHLLLPIFYFVLQSAGFDTPSKEDMAVLLVAAIQIITVLASSVIVDKAGKYNALY